MTEAFSNRPTTVADYLVIFRRRKWIVLVPPVVAAAAAFALSTGQSPLYRATAQVLVNPPSVVTAITGVDPSGGDPNRFLQTQTSIARSPEFASRVAAESRIPGMTPGRVLSESQVTPSTDSRSTVTRGLGQRPAANTSARATSTPARIARTRGLFGDSRASASDSVSDND